jgi:hypothetical protein
MFVGQTGSLEMVSPLFPALTTDRKNSLRYPKGITTAGGPQDRLGISVVAAHPVRE